jgi:hypothetical protein
MTDSGGTHNSLIESLHLESCRGPSRSKLLMEITQKKPSRRDDGRRLDQQAGLGTNLSQPNLVSILVSIWCLFGVYFWSSPKRFWSNTETLEIPARTSSDKEFSGSLLIFERLENVMGSNPCLPANHSKGLPQNSQIPA